MPDEDNRSDYSMLLHLGAHAGIEGRPTLDELGVAQVHDTCRRLWQYRGADLEPSWTVPLHESQWRETCALAGSIAESLMLAVAAYIEARWHERLVASGGEPHGMVIGQRYLADSSLDTSIAAGHRLINLLARVARTQEPVVEAFDGAPRWRLLGSSYRPFETEDRDAWLSLNAGTVTALRKFAPLELTDAFDAAAALVASSAWKDAWQVRAENFHRWRKEHESVAGIDQQSGRNRDLYDDSGRRIGRATSSTSRPAIIANGMTDSTTDTAGRVVVAVAGAAERCLDATLAALPVLTFGEIKSLTITPSGFQMRRGAFGRARGHAGPTYAP